MLDSDNPVDVPPDTLAPFYDQEEPVVEEEAVTELSSIPQGPGSSLDSDTVDGFQAVTADKAGPNKLVATDNDGKLPASVMSSSSTLLAVIWGK